MTPALGTYKRPTAAAYVRWPTLDESSSCAADLKLSGPVEHASFEFRGVSESNRVPRVLRSFAPCATWRLELASMSQIALASDLAMVESMSLAGAFGPSGSSLAAGLIASESQVITFAVLRFTQSQLQIRFSMRACALPGIVTAVPLLGAVAEPGV